MENSKNNRFMQGYICAVCACIYMEGCVSTPIRELYIAGAGDHSLEDFEEMGIDESDLAVIRKHWNPLHNIFQWEEDDTHAQPPTTCTQ